MLACTLHLQACNIHCIHVLWREGRGEGGTLPQGFNFEESDISIVHLKES